jgi:hypothetical protein
MLIQSQPAISAHTRPRARTDLPALAYSGSGVADRRDHCSLDILAPERLVHTPQTRGENAMKIRVHSVTGLKGITLAVAVRM